MRKLIYIFFLICLCCNSQNESEFEFNLDKCLTKDDLFELDNALYYFELELEKKYGDKNINKAYLLYLEDISQGRVEFDFFINTEANEILEKLKRSKTFDKIWISLSTAVSEIRDENGLPILNDPDNKKLVIINKHGDYQKCVKKSSNNKSIENYINFEIENPGLSFSLSARELSYSLNEFDLEIDLNKLVIALGFYYEYVYMINKYME